jgi:hypothetical protein
MQADRTLKDALEARRGGGAEKGSAVDRVRRNRRGEDRQNYKNQKTHKTNREKQYREILKQIQGNLAKTKYEGKSKQKNNTKETKYMETK